MEQVQEKQRAEEFDASEIEYVSYGGEHHLPLIMNLVDQELSEPYSIFTYRYFVYLWPQLSFMAFHKGKCVGTVVCKMGDHRDSKFRDLLETLKEKGHRTCYQIYSSNDGIGMRRGNIGSRSNK
ncbi:hypothetical protein OIU76_025679 [Salix suchowensis]|nr:hypothetical protein OIU76_025679 [Salix suchowensis]